MIGIVQEGAMRNYVCVDITWENNTGGTNQNDDCVGDGKIHFRKDSTGIQVTASIRKPFRVAYSMRPGSFAYISAQKDQTVSIIKCNIYLTDEEGANCMVYGGDNCRNIKLWKTGNCTGDYCICDAEGVFNVEDIVR